MALARPTFFAAPSVHAPQQRHGVVMGSFKSLVAGTEIVTPVITGFILEQSLYSVWIGTVVAIAIIGATIAASRPPKVDPEASAAGT